MDTIDTLIAFLEAKDSDVTNVKFFVASGDDVSSEKIAREAVVVLSLEAAGFLNPSSTFDERATCKLTFDDLVSDLKSAETV